MPEQPDITVVRPRVSRVARRSLGGNLANGAFVMVVLTTSASIANYGSNLVFSRLLEPARYGDLTALLALVVVLAVPTGAAQTIIAERVAVLGTERRVDDMRYFVRHAFAHVVTITVAASVVYAASIPLVTSALGLEGYGPAIALLPLLVASFLVPVALGVLQGLDRFVVLGFVTLFIAVSRTLFGVPLVELTGGAGGALAAQALGSVIALAGVAWVLRRYLLRRGTGAATTGVRRRPNARTAAAGAAFVAFALLSNLDIVLAKLFLSRHDVGMYAALSTVGKVVLFLPAAIAVVMVPNAARARHTTGSSAQVLRIAASLVVLTTALAAIPAALSPRLVIAAMFGSQYADARPGVLPIVCAGAGLALLYLLVVYSVAIQDRRWVALLAAGVVFQIAGISMFHDSPTEIATVQAVVMLGLLLVNEVAFHPLLRSRPVRGRATI